VSQFEGKVVLYSELDSKSDFITQNQIGSRSPPCCVWFLGSPEPSWCPTCSLGSTPWFLITIKSLGSKIFARSLVNRLKNKFTWWFSRCAHDLVIGPCNSMEEVVVSDVVMSSSYTRYMSITSKVSAVFAHQFRTTHPPSRITYVGWLQRWAACPRCSSVSTKTSFRQLSMACW
jgi:hypothetical protein